ncbi:DNA ligase 4-like isoform X2 [Paramacrobiotus metropolitanus]|nr:DNA ligase 4-like isoform X2 [Paramacrobiotus metropolitanus]
MDLFHKDAKDMFAAHAKLSVVCQKLCDNKVRKPQYGVQLMEPLLPMRAELWDFSKIDAALRITPLIAEIKYDGERFQIHKDGKRFRFFSRPGNDYTAVLGETATEGTLLQYIAHCFRPHAESFIIDGELCPYYTKKRCFGSKADINWMKKLTGSSGCQLCFVAFDILHLNGQVLMDRPWRDRVEILKGLFAEEEGRLVYSIRREFSIIDECMDFLNEIANTEEGLIIKDPRSVYQPKIQSPYWWKLKPEFVGSLCEQLDLLIIGAYRGHGNSVAGNFLLGVIDANNGGADEQPKRFFSICNIAVGFKRTELESLVLKLIPHLRPWDNHSQPDFIVLGSREACRPDYWVHPNVSAVVQVRASQLIRNDGFGAGFALRFPRVVQIRSDKNWSDTTTLSDINRIDRERNRRLGAVNVNVDDLRHPARSFSFRRSSEGSRLPVHEWFVTPKDLTIKSGLFMGKEFCVTTGDDTGEKERIQRLILENGGTCTLHRSNTTFCVISTKVCTKVRNMVIRDPLDIVRPTWIERCIASGSILPWHPDDLLYSKPRTSMVVKRSYDENDDSFTEDVDVDEVERLFSKMDAKLLAETISKDKLDDFVMEKFCSIFWANELILFRGLSFFVLNRQSSIMLEVVADAIKHFGGLVKLNMEEQPSHVVVQRDVNSDDVDALKTTCHKSKIRVVAWTWVIDCISELRLLDEREYYPHEAFTKKIIPSVISVFDCLSDPVAPVIPVV